MKKGIKTGEKLISFTAERDVSITTESGESFLFPSGSVVKGLIRIEQSSIPLEEQEDRWTFFDVGFLFPYHGEERIYMNTYRGWKLWPGDPRGKFVATTAMRGFRCDAGPICDVIDAREHIVYELDSREERAVWVKYMDTSFELMLRKGDMMIRCRHYHGEISDYQTIYYSLSYWDILFRPAILTSGEGADFDADFEGAGFVEII